jgi:hypothetical protein
MAFYPKYLKYKKKYLDLKEQMGGDECINILIEAYQYIHQSEWIIEKFSANGIYANFVGFVCNFIKKQTTPDAIKKKNEKTALINILDIFTKIFLLADGVDKNTKIKELTDFLTYYTTYFNEFTDLYNIISSKEKEATIKKLFIENNPNEIFNYMTTNRIDNFSSATISRMQ